MNKRMNLSIGVAEGHVQWYRRPPDLLICKTSNNMAAAF